jgi:hypothetical protein
MRIVYLQYWEESDKEDGLRPDGCSLHIDLKSHYDYVDKIYKDRNIEDIPDIYDKIVGNIILVNIKEELYLLVLENSVVRLFEYEFNNLVKMKELLI